jgi:hypothetical protein
MSVELYLHGRTVESVFQLLGDKENDMTYSFGWALTQSPGLRKALLRRLFPRDRKLTIDRVLLQEHTRDGGYTDIELLGPNVHVIIEAKRGWVLPTRRQLALYALRLPRDSGARTALVTTSECSTAYARLHLDKAVDGVRIAHVPWNDVQKLSHIRKGSHAEKRLLAEFRTYLERIVKMQNQMSNMVFVVSIGSGTPKWSQLSWQDMITKRRRYFNPVGNGWPKEPPNYIGFRYGGRLQSIHHIERWKITTDVHEDMPELNPGRWRPHFLYTLGAPIIPPKIVKTGKIYRNGRVWAMLDLLLTCDTISQARDRTKKRLKQGG